MKKNIITLTIIIISLLFSTIPKSNAFAEKISLLTKNNHCIWVIHDLHEAYHNIPKERTKLIIEKGKQDIKHIAHKLYATVYVEDGEHFTSMPDFEEKYAKRLRLRANKKPMLLSGLYNFLKANNIPTINVENRPFLFKYYKDRKNKKNLMLYKELEKNTQQLKILSLITKWKTEDAQEFSKWEQENFTEWKNQKYDKFCPELNHKQKARAIKMLVKYSYYNDAFTITKILNNLAHRKLHKKYIHNVHDIHDIHDIIATGSIHSKRIEHSLKHNFGYKEVWYACIPKCKNKSPKDILKIKKCFEKGLNFIKKK